jgi:mannose-6-phosphate isomerase
MQLINEPLVFRPVYKNYLWGGDKITDRYARTQAPHPCAESWEISAHPDGASVVASGTHIGRNLCDLVAEFGVDLVGSRAPDPTRFPLLFKIIDARRQLSVQVHPNNANAALTAGDPKSEMWYVLGCEPGSTLYAGLKEKTGAGDLLAALESGKLADLLNQLRIAPGQALFIPGGLVHAIGAGALIYEVQQSSNTTYRLFDWNRRDAQGHARELHIEQSLKTIDWTLPTPSMLTPQPESATTASVLSCELCTMHRLTLTEPLKIQMDGSTFMALFVTTGSVRLRCGKSWIDLKCGSSALIPASADAFFIEPHTNATLLVTTL